MSEGPKLKADALELFESGKTEEALTKANQALAKLLKEGNQTAEAELLAAVVVEAYLARHDGDRAMKAANEALAIAQRSQDSALLATTWSAVTSARLESGSEDTMEAGKKALSYYQDTGNKPKQVAILGKLAQCSLYKGEPMGALGSAKEAMTLAKSTGNGALVGEAAMGLVEANIANGTKDEALSAAEDAYVSLSKGADRAGLIDAMSAMVVALTEKSGPDVALAKVKSFVEESRASGYKKGEAAMLHKLGCVCTSREESKNAMSVALEIAKKEGDFKLEAAIKMSLTDLYAGIGKVEKAPNRKEALGILAEVGRALEDKNGEKFEEEYKHLTNFWNALTQHDFDKIISKVVAKDEKEYTKFLKEHGILQEEEKAAKRDTGESVATQEPVAILYMEFRFGGLGYGPRFRACCPYGTQASGDAAESFESRMMKVESYGVIQLQDCSDDWERELGYNSSMMDACLHTASAGGYANRY